MSPTEWDVKGEKMANDRKGQPIESGERKRRGIHHGENGVGSGENLTPRPRIQGGEEIISRRRAGWVGRRGPHPPLRGPLSHKERGEQSLTRGGCEKTEGLTRA